MKSFIFGNVSCLFSESEKTIIRHTGEDEGEPEVEYGEVKYTTTAGNALEKLEVMGFTVERSRKKLRKLLNSELADGPDGVSGISERAQRLLVMNEEAFFRHLAQLRLLQGDYYLKELGDVSRLEDIHDFIHDALEDGSVDIRYILALLLGDVESGTKVELDLSDLICGGYYEAQDAVIALAQDELLRDISNDEKILILTEGSTDAWIIKSSLDLLMPHLSDRFAFLDHSKMNPKGGATALAELIKAFASSGIRNKVIGIFDNDTAARDAHRMVEAISLPNTIVTIFLPSIELATDYPTIESQGKNITLDVNSLAVSIEMFVCEDLLKRGGKFIPVRWAGIIPSQGKRQGEIDSKSQIFKKFKARIGLVRKGGACISDFDWSAMKQLLMEIKKAASNLNPP